MMHVPGRCRYYNGRYNRPNTWCHIHAFRNRTDTTFSISLLYGWGATGNDIYMLSVPWGYSVEVCCLGCSPGSGTSVQDLIYTGIYTCDTFDLGLYGGISSFLQIVASTIYKFWGVVRQCLEFSINNWNRCRWGRT